MMKFGLILTLAVAMTAIANAQNLEPNFNSHYNQDIQTFNVPAETLAPVPEPTPYLIFGLGALVLAFGRWRALRSRGNRR